jgi:zinc transporter
MVPQRELLSRLQNERAEWLSDMDKLHLRESAERTVRCIEDLDAARDRADRAESA